MLSDRRWTACCSTARCSTSPARAASARRPSPRRSGSPPRRAGGARSSARSPSRTACRAPSPARACARAGGRARREPVGDHDRPDAGAARSGSPSSSAAARRVRLLSALARVPALRRRRAGREGADHDREGLGARPARALGRATTAPTTSWWSTRPPPATASAMLTTPRTFGEIARVGPIRRQAYKVRDMLARPGRTGYVAVALPEEMPVNETLELGARLRGRGRPRARRDRGQRRSTRSASRGARPRRCAPPRRRARARGAVGRARGAGRARARAGAARAPAPAQARGGRARAHAAVPVRAGGRARGVPQAGGELGRDLERAR